MTCLDFSVLFGPKELKYDWKGSPGRKESWLAWSEMQPLILVSADHVPTIQENPWLKSDKRTDCDTYQSSKGLPLTWFYR